MNNSWDFAGSRWWKFDFHSHTPASFDYGRGDTSLQNIPPREWLLNYMRAEIDCIAITDHNCGAWIDTLKNEYSKMKNEQVSGFRELYIFPGVEITVQNGIHVLAIFGTEKGSADIASILGACGFTGNHGESKDCTSISITDVFQKIITFGGIAIPAHVDEDAGLFLKITDGTTLDRIFRDSNVYCAEIVNPSYTFPSKHDELKAHWSSIAGSDSHKPEEIGRRYTWVKMGVPSLEGLKLALMDGDDFSIVRFDNNSFRPNDYSDFIIKNIKITNAVYCGNKIDNPFHMEFNPWLNCIIGGRGSGKSTIVEFLRIAMRRENEIDDFDEDSDIFKSFKEFNQVQKKRDGKGVLRDNTTISAECILNGTSFLVQWANDGSLSSIMEKKTDNEFQPSSGEIPVRFPVRIYSQKQIFEMSNKPEALFSRIDEAPEVNYREWKNISDQISAQYRSLKTRERELDVQIREENSLSGELEDVKRKLSLFEKGENAHIRKEYQLKRSQEKEINSFIESLSDNCRQLQNVELETVTPRMEYFSSGEDALVTGKLIDDYINKMALLNKELLQTKDKLTTLINDFQADIETSLWNKNLTITIEKFNSLNDKLKTEGVSNPEEYGIFIQKKQLLENKLAVIQNLKNTKDNLVKQSTEELVKLIEHRKRLTSSRKQFVSSILENNSLIRIDIEECADKKNLENSFRYLIGRDDSFQEDILSEDQKRGLLSTLYNSFDYNKLSDLKQTIKKLKLEESNPPTPFLKKNNMLNKKFISFLQKSVTDEMIDSIDLWFPEDKLTIFYKRESGKSKFVPIEQGSPGQKTAAILAFLLSYGKEPIILDQPEDDLDNHLIYDLVVNQVRENKKRRQIIIVTHNPNIVVNGDAEMVHALAFRNGEIEDIQKGCLQEKNIRLEICQVMEGGRLAFEQRFRRINIGELYV